MDYNYLSEIANQFGVSLWLFAVIMIWSTVWKVIALWKSARKSHVAWFIILFLINTIGILEILYIYVFSEMNCCKNSKKEIKSNKKITRKKTVKKKNKKKK